MSLAPVDVIEEDAADLQFPKDTKHHSAHHHQQPPITTVRPTAATVRRIRHYRPTAAAAAATNATHPSASTFLDTPPTPCLTCSQPLREPYIQCAECPAQLCAPCFASGREHAAHRSHHAYCVRHDQLRVFAGSAWTAGEEKQLLHSLELRGHGNWSAVARDLNARLPPAHRDDERFRYTATEVREHYERHYFGGVFEAAAGLPAHVYEPLLVPYLYRMNSVDPPRLEASAAAGSAEAMAGYRAARGEFEVPYDNSAEAVVAWLDEVRWTSGGGGGSGRRWESSSGADSGADWKAIGEELQCAMMLAYNNRLRERQRRYDIMRDHGLLQTSRTLAWLSKHSEALCPTHTQPATGSTGAQSETSNAGGGGGGNTSTMRLGGAGRFVSLMQLCQPIAFDLLVESLQYAHDLRRYLIRLYELRRQGVRTFHGGRVYHRLRARRTSRQRNRREEQFAEQWEWKQLVPAYEEVMGGDGRDSADADELAMMALHHSAMLAGGGGGVAGAQFLSALAVKRKSTPLEILGLPGYERLTEAERELCSTVRLVPLSYLGYKQILTAENAKSGYLRLADARRLIKIDVNKTRQLYDFLLKQGFINKLFN